MKTLKKKQLFWDSDGVDPQKNAKFIIERVLTYGDEKDFKWADKFFGANKLKEVVCQSRNLDKKSFNFWCQFFNIKKEECKISKLANQRELFWKR